MLRNLINVLGLPYLISAITLPILGLVIDRQGRNVFFVTTANVITLIAHTLFAFGGSKWCAYIAVVVMGSGYSLLAASLWPIIALVIDQVKITDIPEIVPRIG